MCSGSRGNEAFNGYRRICPAYLEEESEVHETEPCVYAQTVTGQAAESDRVQVEVTL